VHAKDSGTYPRTCQSMVNTLQDDGLARITGLSGSYSDSSSVTERRPPMPCMTYWVWTGGGLNNERDGSGPFFFFFLNPHC